MSDEPDTNLREPTAEELEEFMRQGQARMNQAGPALPAVSLPPELANRIERERALSEEDDVPDQARAQEPSSDMFNVDLSETKVVQDIWKSDLEDSDTLIRVGVSETERTDYFRAMLTDERFQCKVKVVFGPSELEIVIGDVREDTKIAIGHALNQMSKGDSPPIYDVASWASWYQYMMVLCSIVRIGDQVFPDIEEQLSEPKANVREILESATRGGPLRWRESRWFAVRRAWRIFNEKTRICREAWRNGDFPEPPGTGS